MQQRLLRSITILLPVIVQFKAEAEMNTQQLLCNEVVSSSVSESQSELWSSHWRSASHVKVMKPCAHVKNNYSAICVSAVFLAELVP